MAFESFGAVDVWSSNQPEDSNSNFFAAGKMATASFLGLGVFSHLTREKLDGTRPIDTVSQVARTVGNLSPMQLGNTFRVPEFLFPWTSPDNQKLINGKFTVSQEFLKSQETEDYLRRITGKTHKELHDLGLSSAAQNISNGAVLEYESTGVGRGSLFSVQEVNGGQKKTLLTKDVMLMSMDSETDPFTNEVRHMNRATRGVVQALGMYEQPGFSDKKLFAQEVVKNGETTWEKLPVLFVPSVEGEVKGKGDFLRRTSYFRGIAAFEMSRFNDLMGGFFREIGAGPFFKNVLGMSPEALKGPASSMFLRYGVRAAGLGAVALGVSQSDWVRREYGLPGRALASGLTTAGGMYMARKLGVSNRLLMMGGVASFAGQMILPGFDKGILQGFATLGAGADIVRSAPINPFSYYRRTLEGFAPGISSGEMGAGAALAVLGASYMRLPGTGKRISEHLVERLGAKFLGLDEGKIGVAPDELLNSKDIHFRFLEQFTLGNTGSENWRTTSDRVRIVRELRSRFGTKEASTVMNGNFRQSEEAFREIMEKSPINKLMLDEMRTASTKYQGGNWFQKNILKNVEGFGIQAYYSFFGADATWNSEISSSIKKLGYKGPVGSLGRFSTLVLAAFGMQQILTGGLLGSMQNMDDTIGYYSGEKLVEMKDSRYWEGGGTPYEGGDTKYFRPSEFSLWMNRVREKGIWGEDEDRISPIGKWVRQNFTYDLERLNFYDRPYPISSAAFQDVPIIGGLLSSTIGMIIKPPALMHAEEWARQGENGTEYKHIFEGSRREPAYALGAKGPGIPTTEFTAAQQAKFISYQFRELEGMTGWAKGIMQGLITGQPQWATPSPVLASANDISSQRVMFWEAEMGGGAFMNEMWRRLYPRDMPGVEKENPIRNMMPSWLPDKFHYGDPYRIVQWGEARLPGAGYAALHPELKGVDPADYPLMARYAILADVDPTSMQFRETQEILYERRMQGMLNEDQEKFIDETDRRVAQIVNRKDFEEADPNAILLPGSQGIRSAYLGLQGFVREAAAPFEFLSPMGFRPTQKLTGQNRGMIEEYEATRLYGTNMAFWDKPWRDWFRPSLYSAAHFMGWEGKPLWRSEADRVDAEFDKLSFNKWMKLGLDAEAMGDVKAKNKYFWAASQTRMGVNPMGSPLSIYWSLPESDRAFFNAFSMAQGSERERILEMIPEDQAHLYTAMWSRLDSGDPTAKMGGDSVLDEEYLKTRYYEQGQQSLPPEDWVGWHQEVDMDDIKVRYADRYASDLTDYGMWEKQLRKSMNQPFLGGSETFIPAPGILGSSNVASSIRGITGGSATSFVSSGRANTNITMNDGRDSEIALMMANLLNPY